MSFFVTKEAKNHLLGRVTKWWEKLGTGRRGSNLAFEQNGRRKKTKRSFIISI